MPISIDLHEECPFYKKWNKKKWTIFFSCKFHIVLREQIAIPYQIFNPGNSNLFLNVLNLQRWVPRFIFIKLSEKDVKEIS